MRPNHQPEWQQLVEGGTVCTWTRDIGDVSVSCDDRIEDGRVLRSKPAIHYSEEPGRGEGIDPATARRFAAMILEAADELDPPTS